MAATATKRETRALASVITRKLKGKLGAAKKRAIDTVQNMSDQLQAELRQMGVTPDHASIKQAIESTQTNLKHALRNLRMVSEAGYPAEAGYSQDHVRALIIRERAAVKGLKARLSFLHKALKRANPKPGAFERCVREVEKKGGAVSPRGVCAAAGRKKYGQKKFQEMAAAGKRAAGKQNSLRGKLKRVFARGGYMVLDGDGLPVHTGRDLPKGEALRIAKEARAAGEKGVHLVRSNSASRRNSDIVDRVKQQIVELEDRYRIHPTKAIEKALDALRVKFAQLSRGNPAYMLTLGFLNPVTSIGQGAVRADVYSHKGQHAVRIRGQEPQIFKSKDAALKYARLRVHELAQNPRYLTSKLLARLKGKRGTSNPEASAAEMYQVFHGLPAEKVIEYRQTEHVHEWLWAVGTLRNLHVSNGKKTITLGAPDPKSNPFEDVVMVCMSEDGKQFHFRGGDQSLPLDEIAEAFDLNEDDVREHMEIGRVTQMTYQTRKTFEDQGKVNVDFYHDLGKEHAQNKLPLLEYKPLNPSMDLVGGRYKVGAFDKSIGASPGIIG